MNYDYILHCPTCKYGWEHHDRDEAVGCCIHPGQRLGSGKRSKAGIKIGEIDFCIHPIGLWLKGCPVWNGGEEGEEDLLNIYGPYIVDKTRPPARQRITIVKSLGMREMDLVKKAAMHWRGIKPNVRNEDFYKGKHENYHPINKAALEFDFRESKGKGSFSGFVDVKWTEYGIKVYGIRSFTDGTVKMPYRAPHGMLLGQEPVCWEDDKIQTAFLKRVKRELGA